VIVVSDASPLHYLVLIKHPDVLHNLFGAVIVPTAVVAELTHSSTPDEVRSWVAVRPEWLKVQSPRQPDPTSRLGPGEREAIGLASELKADFLLIDERQGRAVAEARGIAVIGVLGVLIRASEKGLLSLADSISDLQRTSFRADPKLIAEILRQSRANE
jgi:predicted nucleic acid-binding protein